jgi:CelD/BcsL family acetyltransferase involved in cellulose biosynthesis
MLSLEVVTDVLKFRALKSEWNSLAATFGNPLYLHEWFDHCLTAFGEEADLKLLVARRDGVVRAIAPLIIDRSESVPHLRFLTHPLNELMNGFLYADDASLTTVCAGVLRSGFPLSLRGLGVDSKDLQALCKSSWMKGLVLRRMKIAVASVRLHTDWKSIETQMSSAYRSEIRRKRSAAEREGPIKFDVVSPTEENLDYYLSEAFRLEASGWKGRAGTAILSVPKKKRFWREFSLTAVRLGLLRLFFLQIGGINVAVTVAAEYAHRLWEYKIGYDERFARYAPGILLTQETLRYATEQRLDAFEFLGQLEPWQQRWPIELRFRCTLRFYPVSIDGGLALGGDSAAFLSRLLHFPLHFH